MMLLVLDVWRAAETAGGDYATWRRMIGPFTMLGIGIFGVVKARSFWNGNLKKVGATWGVFGPEWAKVGQAISPVALLVALAGGLGTSIDLVSPSLTGSFASITSTARDLFIAIFLIGGLAVFSIVLSGRPKFLIPPYTRDFNGVLAYWITGIARALRRRRGSPSDRQGSEGSEL